MSDRPRALLIWPGGLFGGGANFGVPQILSIASAMEAAADVDVVDLDIERAFGPVDLEAIALRAPYDLVGIACYSSYDYLKVMELGARVRAVLPKAWLVSGGYHASARPEDFTGPASPFDFVVVGDGEGPMQRLANAVATGKRPLLRVLGPSSAQPSRVDWEKLARYKPVFRKVASQAEIYLSRGCPYDCAFCMERAKRDTSWRALEPLEAVEELHRLDRFLDLSGLTLFIADALFGMKVSWRRTFLEALANRPIRSRKTWLLVRLDLLEREDLVLMGRANIAAGFGLESGDPEQVKRIRKVGRLSDYLDQMMRVADWARESDVPWGANVIVGHPGETERSLRTTAAYLERLFLDPRGTTGFLSVDPFRLYPGSPIDEEKARWEADTGMRVHRYPWWHDGDQDFLAEWVDPSGDLDFRRAHALRHELFAPLVHGIAKSFVYGGAAGDYFRRAIDEQIELLAPSRAARTLALDHLWRKIVPVAGPSIGADRAFAAFSRDARRAAIEGDDAIASALIASPREQFVPIDVLPEAHLDVALPLDESNRATISAMHAYAAQLRALSVGPGDHVVDLGGGTGYGASVAARAVGEAGRVTCLEIDPVLAAKARALAPANVEVIAADAHDVERWRGATKVMVGFDVGTLPDAWIDALALGGRLVVPLSGTLTLIEKSEAGAIARRALATVLFVRDRSDRREVHRLEPGGVLGAEAMASRASAEQSEGATLA